MSLRVSGPLQTATTSLVGLEMVQWIGIGTADYARAGRDDKSPEGARRPSAGAARMSLVTLTKIKPGKIRLIALPRCLEYRFAGEHAVGRADADGGPPGV